MKPRSNMPVPVSEVTPPTPNPTSYTAAKIVTGTAVGGTILFALGPGLVALASGGELVPYDGAIAMGAANAIIVAVYTYFTRQALDVPRQIAAEHATRERLLREEERASLATALLAELSRLWGRLVAIRLGGGADSPSAFFIHVSLDRAVEKLALFDSKTIEVITTLKILVADVETGLAHYREMRRQVSEASNRVAELLAGRLPFQLRAGEQTQFTDLDRRYRSLREEAAQFRTALGIRSTWALHGISTLVPLLRAAGGQMPGAPMETETPLNRKLPIPKDPFPRLGGELRLNLVIRDDKVVDLGSDDEAAEALKGQDYSARKLDNRAGVEAFLWYLSAQEEPSGREFDLVLNYIEQRQMLAAVSPQP